MGSIKDMRTFIVHKKCVATDFVSVKAVSKEDALKKAKEGEGKSLNGYLEFRGYLPNCCWDAEDITNAHGDASASHSRGQQKHPYEESPLWGGQYPNGAE
jgi:hypothetical protein